jgi:hypothetical protein
MMHVARDESRHMVFGVQMVRNLTATSEAARRAVIALINRVLPWVVSVFIPPNFDEDYVRVFGMELADVYAFGLRSFEAKLTRAGIAPAAVATLVNNGVDLAPIDQARRILRLARAGVIGDAMPIQIDEPTLGLLFDGVERMANMAPTPLPGAVQWDFADAEPWYLATQEGRMVVRQGRAAAPALTMRLTADDWGRIAGNKLDARWAMLTRRLAVSGDLRLALRLPKVLGLSVNP